jgi:hypothetical protein
MSNLQTYVILSYIIQHVILFAPHSIPLNQLHRFVTFVDTKLCVSSKLLSSSDQLNALDESQKQHNLEEDEEHKPEPESKQRTTVV